MGTTLSLVIPAFNEESRLPAFLVQVRGYLEGTDLESYEVIVVNDGSTDATARLVVDLAETWPLLRLMGHDRNLGKGAAVRLGVLSARSDLILFADADGATPLSEELSLREAIAAGADLAVGSRIIGGSVGVIRSQYRAILGRAFARAVRLAVPVSVRDPQCGFKLFRREVGRHLFGMCSENGYLFDLEVLALADRLGYRATEVSVRWREMPGSKVRPFRDAWRMAWGLARVRHSVRRVPYVRGCDRETPRAAGGRVTGPIGGGGLES